MGPVPMKLARLILIPCALAGFGCASMWPAPYRIDAHVPSNSGTVVWGYLPAGRPPVLTIRSGQTVKIDTVSHQGLLSGMGPGQVSSARRASPRRSPPGRERDLREARRARRTRGACAHRADLRGRRGTRRHAGSAHARLPVPRALRSEQQQQGHWRAARRAREAVPEGDPLRPRAPRRALCARYRGAARSLHGHHGGDAARPARQHAAARHLRRKHGFQPPHGRRAPLFARASARRALLHGRFARGAGRRRDQRHRDRGFAHAGPAVRRAQGRGRRD